MNELEEYKAHFLSPTGLFMMDPDDKMVTEKDGIKYNTVKNENGILFHSYMMLAGAMVYGKKAIEPFRDGTKETIELLQDGPGVFNRNIGVSKMEAFDNYLGICGLSRLYGFKKYPKEILTHGKKNFYNYSQDGKWHIESQHQLGEIMIYKLAAGDDINPILMTAFCTGMNLGVKSEKKSSSQALLQWLRFYIVRTSDFGGISDAIWQHFKPGFQEAYKKKWKNMGNVARKYFWDPHPLCRLMEKIDNPWENV